MKKYPSYKGSGIEWMGKIPEHWQTKKLKYSDLVIMGQSPSSEDYNISYAGLPFLQGNADFTDLHPLPRIYCETANKIAETNDILLSVRAPIGAVNIANQKYGIGRGLCAIRAVQTFQKYLYYEILCLNDELNSIGTGSTYTAISVDEIKNVLTTCPSLAEQTIIAGFLDRKTQQIDFLIEKKQKMIELLKEERTAIISHAVTKGLNTDVKMKDSGIEWLGEIPEHWSSLHLKWLLKSSDYGLSENLAGEGQYKVLTMTHIQDGEILLPEKGCIEEVPSEMILDSNDLLFNRTNSADLVAKVGIFRGTKDDKVSFASYLVRMRPNEKAVSEYLNYYLNSQKFISYARSLALPSINQSNLNPTRYGQIQVCIPSVEEQNSIVDYLSTAKKRIEGLIKKEEVSISLLQEYRTALISEVVTGKIDIRDEVTV